MEGAFTDVKKKTTESGSYVNYLFVMVGLPARGKTYISRHLARYLQWIGFKTTVFNMSHYRRDLHGPTEAEFYDPTNTESMTYLRKLHLTVLDDALKYLEGDGEVAFFDGTNHSLERRRAVLSRVAQETNPPIVVFIESICEDLSIIHDHIENMDMYSPDYLNNDRDTTFKDVNQRISFYRRDYKTLTDDEGLSYIKVFDLNHRVEVNNIGGYVPARIVFLLMNLNPNRHEIWFTRHGESNYNTKGLLGGDPKLSPRGEIYAEALGEFIRGDSGLSEAAEGFDVWTSCLRRTIQTAAELNHPTRKWRELNEINAGLCEGMTYEQVAEKYPHISAARAKDKLRYRYPAGESYLDVVMRVEPVIMELERAHRPTVVVAHQAILRAILGYFLWKDPDSIPHMSVPLHSVLKLTRTAYTCRVEVYELDSEQSPPRIVRGRRVVRAQSLGPHEPVQNYVTSPVDVMSKSRRRSSTEENVAQTDDI
eukprot:TRINITY_DN2522_c0_g1_i3.p1 TRINITY_DN2522_c0_g1~~TRINITY_DN2522_c0_g1_i3.p1  ORF type:complete len:480 (-),score=65.54 TRINITY_DN2522_c0_g1_i3:1128-2567(-)